MRNSPEKEKVGKEMPTKKLLYVLSAVAAMAPLAAFGTASAAPAHPAAADAHTAGPLNLPGLGKCFKITDADSGNYGSLYYSSYAGKIVSSHSHYTSWCPAGLTNGWQVLAPFTPTGYDMAFHASGNYLTDYVSYGHSPTCNYQPGATNGSGTANNYCEFVEFKNSSGNWDIENADNGEYITRVSSGKPVELAAYGTGDQHWTVTCTQVCG